MGAEEGIHPYIHNKKGRRNAFECGCAKCKVALDEYWNQEAEFENKKQQVLKKLLEDYRDAVRAELMEEMRSDGKA